jgi:hypothetical protein
MTSTCNASYLGSGGMKINNQGQPRQKLGPYVKNKLRYEGLRGIAQIVEYLNTKEEV